jgi:hypothetical protein
MTKGLIASDIFLDFKPSVLDIQMASNPNAELSFINSGNGEYNALITVDYDDSGGNRVLRDFELKVDKFFIIREDDSLYLFNGLDKIELARLVGGVVKSWELVSSFSFSFISTIHHTTLQVTPKLIYHF